MATSPGAATLERHAGHVAGRALGCDVYLATSDPDHLPAAARLATELLDRVDRACSRFRIDSDLVRANARSGQWVEVDPLLAAALEVAMRAAASTDGLVDPTLGRSLAAMGYDRDFTFVPAVSADPITVPPPGSTGGWAELDVDPAGAVRVPRGQLLDLGATAKAWAADLVAEAVHDVSGDAVAVSLGGDVRVVGEVGVRWPVQITELPERPTPSLPARDAASGAPLVLLPPGGLATSGTAHRRWQRGAEHVHHVIDPLTRREAHGPWRTVSATGATAVDANTTTTAALVLGDGAIDWLVDRGAPARLVAHDGRVVTLNAWPADEVA